MTSLRTALSLCMPAIYALAGLALLCTSFLEETIVRYRPVLGSVLLGYGLLRATQFWIKR